MITCVCICSCSYICMLQTCLRLCIYVHVCTCVCCRIPVRVSSMKRLYYDLRICACVSVCTWGYIFSALGRISACGGTHTHTHCHLCNIHPYIHVHMSWHLYMHHKQIIRMWISKYPQPSTKDKKANCVWVGPNFPRGNRFSCSK